MAVPIWALQQVLHEIVGKHRRMPGAAIDFVDQFVQLGRLA
jgi:hypothetical protein